MNPENRSKLADRVIKATEAALAAQNYVASVDMLVRIGWLDPGAVKRSRQGQVDLEFLPAGDAMLTRRVKAKSPRHAVVVRFSKSRRRYERQGLLVEPKAVAEAQRELAEQTR